MEKQIYDLVEPTEAETAAFAMQAKLLKEYAAKSETELNAIFDLGMFNQICQGYAVIAMRAAGIDEAEIEKAAAAMRTQFDFYSAADAREACRNL